jgi:hypothetical protein
MGFMVMCADCGERVSEDAAVWIAGNGRFMCVACFEKDAVLREQFGMSVRVVRFGKDVRRVKE